MLDAPGGGSGLPGPARRRLPTIEHLRGFARGHHQLPGESPGSIPGAVIDEDQPGVIFRLLQERRKGLRQGLRLVASRDHDSELSALSLLCGGQRIIRQHQMPGPAAPEIQAARPRTAAP